MITPEQLFQELQGDARSGDAVIHSPVFSTSGGASYLGRPGVVVLARPAVNMTGLVGFLDGFDDSLGF